MIQHQIDVRAGRDGGQAFQEFVWREDEVARAVMPRVAKRTDDAAVGESGQPLLRQRRAQQVAAESFEPEPIIGADVAIGEGAPKISRRVQHPKDFDAVGGDSVVDAVAREARNGPNPQILQLGNRDVSPAPDVRQRRDAAVRVLDGAKIAPGDGGPPPREVVDLEREITVGDRPSDDSSFAHDSASLSCSRAPRGRRVRATGGTTPSRRSWLPDFRAPSSVARPEGVAPPRRDPS